MPPATTRSPAASLGLAVALGALLQLGSPLTVDAADAPPPDATPTKPAAVVPPPAPTPAPAPAAIPAPTPAAIPPALTPQPPGPAPIGKEWSAQHGHWHDVPIQAPPTIGQATPMPAAPGAVSITPMPAAPGAVSIAPQHGAVMPQPDGPVPPGKVWSPEHGHWHDAAPANLQVVPGGSEPQIIQMSPQAMPGMPAMSGTPGTLMPQPEGPVPPGKVWSPEHGHWHDASPSNVQLAPAGGIAPNGGIAPQIVQVPPRPPGTLTPQPEGPVPAGKVWSPEHGHWHDAPLPPPPQPATLPPPAKPSSP